ncbi:hypothetical protein B0T17DRAFT_507920 [Bombardia bombarda]|uniref:Uncharacterized protein n=1 Tax=Bombardia bombarda TaxID=252184 RepID=A0AA39X0S4_9PEZI|nr:hypothetical protein B0T17DRAFT_507920 [Bombardia bombarda]
MAGADKLASAPCLILELAGATDRGRMERAWEELEVADCLGMEAPVLKEALLKKWQKVHAAEEGTSPHKPKRNPCHWMFLNYLPRSGVGKSVPVPSVPWLNVSMVHFNWLQIFPWCSTNAPLREIATEVFPNATPIAAFGKLWTQLPTPHGTYPRATLPPSHRPLALPPRSPLLALSDPDAERRGIGKRATEDGDVVGQL